MIIKGKGVLAGGRRVGIGPGGRRTGFGSGPWRRRWTGGGHGWRGRWHVGGAPSHASGGAHYAAPATMRAGTMPGRSLRGRRLHGYPAGYHGAGYVGHGAYGYPGHYSAMAMPQTVTTMAATTTAAPTGTAVTGTAATGRMPTMATVSPGSCRFCRWRTPPIGTAVSRTTTPMMSTTRGTRTMTATLPRTRRRLPTRTPRAGEGCRPGAQRERRAESGPALAQAAPAPGQIFMYPKNGQSAEQSATDKAECQKWASEQAGQVAQNGSDFNRAMVACVEGRGYSAR